MGEFRIPPFLIYGKNAPNVRFRWEANGPQMYCQNNKTLYLPDALDGGTLTLGTVLRQWCRDCCRSERASTAEPCPAFSTSYVADDWNAPASLGIVAEEAMDLTRCLGVQAFMNQMGAEAERMLFRAYLTHHSAEDFIWREELRLAWNAGFQNVPNWRGNPRRNVFDALMWETVRIPAMLPQVWLNWVRGDEDHATYTAEHPSRLDFLIISHGHGYVVEVDGLSHVADYDGQSYRPNGGILARHHRHDRWLRSQGWDVIRFANDELLGPDTLKWQTRRKLMAELPFTRHPSPRHKPDPAELGVPSLTITPEIREKAMDIPF